VFVKTPTIIQRFFPSIIWKKETSKKKIWLTFDDGPDEKITIFLLNLLKRLQIRATFFLIGKQVVKYPELARKIIEEGHTIGNHSYSHLNGLLTSNKIYYDDIDKAQKIVNSKIYRPPYGKISPIQLRKLKAKYKIITVGVTAAMVVINVDLPIPVARLSNTKITINTIPIILNFFCLIFFFSKSTNSSAAFSDLPHNEQND
jgi:peptidoglycan/xylan/chitin deacetylase (PgdA/CDA1 family)